MDYTPGVGSSCAALGYHYTPSMKTLTYLTENAPVITLYVFCTCLAIVLGLGYAALNLN